MVQSCKEMQVSKSDGCAPGGMQEGFKETLMGQNHGQKLNFSGHLHDSRISGSGPCFTSATIAADNAGPSEGEALKRTHPCTWPNCGKFFLRKTDVTRHLRIHLNERPYPCEWPDCGKSFMQRSAMKIHYRTHTGEKPNKCPFEGCEKAFNDSSSLARHRRTHRFDEPFPCSYRPCDNHFKNRKLLVEHERSVHNAPLPPARKASIKVTSSKPNPLLPTPNATPDTTPNRSENSQFMFPTSSFNVNFNFRSSTAPNLLPLVNSNQTHHQNLDNSKDVMAAFSLSPKPKLVNNVGYEIQQQNSHLQNQSQIFSQSTDLQFPVQSAFHEEFMAQKQRSSSSVSFDYSNRTHPLKEPQQRQMMPTHHRDQSYPGLHSLSMSFDPHSYRYNNSASVPLPLVPKSLLLPFSPEQQQQYPSHRASSFSAPSRDFSYLMNDPSDSGQTESSFMGPFSSMHQQQQQQQQGQQQHQAFLDFGGQPPSIMRQKSRPPRIQTEFTATHHANHFPSHPTDTGGSSFTNPLTAFHRDSDGMGDGRNLMESITEFTGPQTAREPGTTSHFSDLFPPRTTDGFMGFNGFNF